MGQERQSSVQEPSLTTIEDLVKQLIMQSEGGVILLKRPGTNVWLQLYAGNTEELIGMMEKTKFKIFNEEGKRVVVPGLFPGV